MAYDYFDPRLMPQRSPLAMPVQFVDGRLAPARGAGPSGIWLRRVALLVATVVLTAAAWTAPFELFAGDGLTPLEIAGLVLFGPLFVGISCWFCSALAGFLLMVFKPRSFLRLEQIGRPARMPRVAMLAPIRNEDVAAVCARLMAMDASLARTGQSASFDFFLLSDTNDDQIAAREHAEASRLAAHGASAFYYRRRSDNAGRKAGNINDWVRNYGGAYDHMIVLDADSVMSGELLVGLASAMETRPDLGVLQTTPLGVGGETLFARHLQFGIRLYGRVATAGVAWWTGNESLYWGHNAIVRVDAFADSASLPRLRGAAPFGGDILSHDVVEGWFMRRAGWGVAMAPMLDGSYEECPPTLVDEAVRDRRWCQGNLQHLALMGARGLHWLARVQIVMAAMVYAAGPLWFCFMAAGVALRVQQGFPEAGEPWFGGSASQLFELHWSIVLTVVMLFGPKVMGMVLILVDPAERRAFGGIGALSAGFAAEFVMSALLAPVRMLIACRAVLEVVCGIDTGWNAQRRSVSRTSLAEAWVAYRTPTLVGLALLAIAAPFSDLVIWMAPIIIGLLFSAPIAVVTSSVAAGQFARRLGMFVTPEEIASPMAVDPVVEVETEDVVQPTYA
ncbi:MAG: glucans biosynthesis glucosyltransferase MdoH [Caulobacteraceae bacterium]|nr:glucans biosynthesis glucosyltransferase MdoH [Caulobacteraceae bacterium]